MRIRQHAPLLEQSMETLKEIPATMESVRQYIANACKWLDVTEEELDSIQVKLYSDTPDTRIGWDRTCLVSMIFRDSDIHAPVAMCDQEVS